VKSLLLITTLFACACGKSDPPAPQKTAPPSPGIHANCASVAASLDRMATKLPDNAAGSSASAVFGQRCMDDHWPQDVVDCLDRATDRAGIDACVAKLTPEQRGKLQLP
jgi:hypothetical protein